MKKYWRALRYGNARTKRILIEALLLLLLTLVGVVFAATGGGPLWVLIAVFAAIFDVVLLQSVRFGEKELMAQKEQERLKKEGKTRTFGSLSEISEEDFKQLLIAYKVRREHVPIMIDSYPKEELHQVPACVWVEKGCLQFLVFQEKPKYFAIPLRQVTGIAYQKDVEVTPATEYVQMKKPSFLNAMYQSYLPVYSERVRRGRKVFLKNLYILAPGVAVTNTSLKNLCKAVSVPISFDGIIEETYSSYFKEAYRMKILLMDQFYTAAEYKEQISSLLKHMAESGDSIENYMADLERMVSARVVTREVADYFVDYRQKQERKAKK